MEVIRETLWKRCFSTPTKPSEKNSSICLSETTYQHKGTRKKCKKTDQTAIIQWQRQCLMDKPHRKPWPKSKTGEQATFLTRVSVHCITPFCSDALVSPPNLYLPWFWCIDMAAENQQKHLEYTFSIKAPSFHSRTSICARKNIF